MSILLVIARVLPVGLALLGLTAADLDLPDAQFWEAKHALLYIFLGVAFLTSTASGVLQAVAMRAEAGNVRIFETRVQAAVGATAKRVSGALGVNLDEVGVHVFFVNGILVRGRWRRAWLVNVGRHRIGSVPSMHMPRWTPGKGVVGRAWSDEDFICVDWRSIFSTAQAGGSGAWGALSYRDRYGLAWRELQQTGDYQLIAARPIVKFDGNDSQIVGCVAVDAKCGAPADTDDLEAALRELATVVLDNYPAPRGWFAQRRGGY